MHADIHKYMHAYIRTPKIEIAIYIDGTYIHTCIITYIRIYIHTDIQTHRRLLQTEKIIKMDSTAERITFTYLYIHTYIHACMHKYIPQAIAN